VPFLFYCLLIILGHDASCPYIYIDRRNACPTVFVWADTRSAPTYYRFCFLSVARSNFIRRLQYAPTSEVINLKPVTCYSLHITHHCIFLYAARSTLALLDIRYYLEFFFFFSSFSLLYTRYFFVSVNFSGVVRRKNIIYY